MENEIMLWTDSQSSLLIK